MQFTSFLKVVMTSVYISNKRQYRSTCTEVLDEVLDEILSLVMFDVSTSTLCALFVSFFLDNIRLKKKYQRFSLKFLES